MTLGCKYRNWKLNILGISYLNLKVRLDKLTHGVTTDHTHAANIDTLLQL